jgi:hypothetical protein
MLGSVALLAAAEGLVAGCPKKQTMECNDSTSVVVRVIAYTLAARCNL